MGAQCSNESGCLDASSAEHSQHKSKHGEVAGGREEKRDAAKDRDSIIQGKQDPATNGNTNEKREATFAAYANQYNKDGTRKDGNEKRYQKHFRILLLGAGESGKTTFTQQLSLIHNLNQLTPDERKRNTLQALHENIVQCISATAANALRLGIELKSEDKERLESIKTSLKIDKILAEDVQALWATQAMQDSFAQRSRYWILDTAEWLMANVARFAEDDYKPTKQDIILSRRRTTGVSEHTYVVGENAFTIIDVGGQRSERRKWVQFFADVHCIVFFVSAIGFCKVLFEDSNTFQMKEALELFSSTFRVPAPQSGPRIDNDWTDYVFETTPIHLVFNKIDMLEDALATYSLANCFPNYKGSNSKNSALRFLAQTFSERVVSIRSPPDAHYISAAREDDVQELFTKLTTFLIEKEKAGFALNAFMSMEKAREEKEARGGGGGAGGAGSPNNGPGGADKSKGGKGAAAPVSKEKEAANKFGMFDDDDDDDDDDTHLLFTRVTCFLASAVVLFCCLLLSFTIPSHFVRLLSSCISLSFLSPVPCVHECSNASPGRGDGPQASETEVEAHQRAHVRELMPVFLSTSQ